MVQGREDSGFFIFAGLHLTLLVHLAKKTLLLQPLKFAGITLPYCRAGSALTARNLPTSMTPLPERYPHGDKAIRAPQIGRQSLQAVGVELHHIARSQSSHLGSLNIIRARAYFHIPYF